MQAPAEKLGSFYIGAEYDADNRARRDDRPIIYDARDLTTHAVCVGMTGSGKTGLCINLLEEATLDRVPALLIDPKGDITNLLLQFPDLRPQDFQPWIDLDDARRKDLTTEDYAATIAEQWRSGLADWGISGERIRELLSTTDLTIFTPGSDSGVPINIMGSLAAPKLDFNIEAEAIRERIGGTVAALLGLADVRADPIRSREAVLLANIFEHFWRQSVDLDLQKLIVSIQTPPFRQLGVFDIDTYFPEKDRFDLAMSFNNLVASPTFSMWLTGEPLDVDRLFFTTDGKPRHSVLYIAHLNDSERMFFVTLLLENLVTWLRRQSGTTSLRALLYFDEVFGYFPPVAEPPSKRPLLRLLKTARAFGLGCVLVTQNPVDLDYKGLTNAGTWFIGKLQAERDKQRVIEGLQGAILESGGAIEAKSLDDMISRLDSRVFLLHNVHAGDPTLFQTRWAMGYLRGPLTRPQVRDLMVSLGKKPAAPSSAPLAQATPHAPEPTTAPPVEALPAHAALASTPPVLESGVAQVYLPVELGAPMAVRKLSEELGRPIEPKRASLVYEPGIVGVATVRFVDRKWQVDIQSSFTLLTPAAPGPAGVDWAAAETLQYAQNELLSAAEIFSDEQGPFFAHIPEGANSAKRLTAFARDLEDWLYYNQRLTLTVQDELGFYQFPDERERDFKIRMQQSARERRDADVDELDDEFARQIARLQEQRDREAHQKVGKEADYESRKQQEVIGIGESILTYLFGRRSTRAFSTAANRRRLTVQSRMDVEEAEREIVEIDAKIAALREELKARADEVTLRWATALDQLSRLELTPRRTDINVQLVALAWLPHWILRYSDGFGEQEKTLAAYRLPEG